MKAIESAVAGARADGCFEADWAQPRPRRRASAGAAARRPARELHRAVAEGEARRRPERRVRLQGFDGGMGRILRGMKFNFNAFPTDLVLNERIAEKILEAGGFLECGTAPSV